MKYGGIASLISLLLILALMATGCPPREEDDRSDISLTLTSVTITRDIEYGRVDGRPLLLDIYNPLEPIVSPMPAVIWIHGGGWRGGGKFPSRVDSLAKYGFFCVSIDYRLSGEAQFPAAVEDAKCAVRWLRAHAAEYNINPNRIGVWGGSAGGHLSLMVACADADAGLEGNGGWAEYSSRVAAVCSYFGPADLVSIGIAFDEGLAQNNAPFQFIGGTYSEMPQAYWSASPLYHVSADDPPLLLVHGELDPVVALAQSEVIYEAYRDMGLEVTLIEVSGAGHGLIPLTAEAVSPSAEVVEQLVLDFFLRHLVYAD
jgi:acetyl esterase/lipase